MRVLITVSITLVLGASACAQRVADPYSVGLNLLHPSGCPVFVGGVIAGSPAERAGIRAGDRLVAVDGTQVTDGVQASLLLQSNGPTKTTLILLRGDQQVEAVSEHETRSVIYARIGWRVFSGALVPADTTQAEYERMQAFDGRRYVARVFPTHYPANPELFYAGFEIFVLRDPPEVTVGGIEQGPASKAGVHWGDVLISVNEKPIAGKTASELEQMFSAKQPVTMRLQINRPGSRKTVEFRLEKAGEIARQNGKRFVDSDLVPIWANDQELHCFMK